MIDNIKSILKENDIDGRKVNKIANQILDVIVDRYGRDNAVNRDTIPRKREDYIHKTKGNKKVMNSGKRGVTLNQTGLD